jgi:hypothetical protein
MFTSSSASAWWSDVFLKVGNLEPVDVGPCDGVNCGPRSSRKWIRPESSLVGLLRPNDFSYPEIP